MRIKNLLIAACIAVTVAGSSSCKKSVCGCEPMPPSRFKSGDVLVAGAVTQPLNFITAAYWKNGVMNLLPSGQFFSAAQGIAVSGNDIYVIGYLENPAMETMPAYWKNGELHVLAGYGSSATSVYTSGSDVYITGSVKGYPVYWKNGIMHTLAVTPSIYMEAVSIFVSGNDVHVAGNSESANFINTAIYWKNNVPIPLPSIATRSYVRSISASGSDIYIGGTTDSIATIWKNGTPSYLETRSSSVMAIAVSGNDVHAVGGSVLHKGITYWKNGVSGALPGVATNGYSAAMCMAVSGSDVYIGGGNASVATVWKNGIETKFKDSWQINAICIVP